MKLAIISMDAIFGRWNGLDALDQALYRGERASGYLVTDQGGDGEKGNKADAGKNALLRVAESCLREVSERNGTGLAWFCEPDGEFTGGAEFAASLGLAGPVADCSLSTDPALSALEQAWDWLSNGKACRVLVVGVSVKSAAPDEINGCWFPLSKSFQEVHGGEGAAGLLLALDSGERELKPATLTNFPTLELSRGSESIKEKTNTSAPVLLSFAGIDRISTTSFKDFLLSKSGNQNERTIVLHSAEAFLGASAAARLAGLISVSMCLSHRYLPGMPLWDGPNEASLWEPTPFFVPAESSPWLVQSGELRKTQLIWFSENLPRLSIKFTEPSLGIGRPNPSLRCLAYRLFPMAASSHDELLGMMKLLKIQLNKRPDLENLSRRWFEVYQNRPTAPLALMITGSSVDEVLKELEFAAQGVPGAMDSGRDWQTPAGSCFIPKPLGAGSEVCFVYPGAFNSYIGLGRNLFRYFPQIYQWMEPVAADIPGVFCDSYLYPRSLNILSKEELDGLETDLTNDAIAMMTSGMSFAVFHTHILQDVFKIKPSSALGYSLGENSMLFATGVWGEGDAASQALARSPLFTTQLAGPLNTVRESWGLPVLETGSSEDLWSNHLIMTTPERALVAVQAESRVYLTHINTSRQVVIGGETEACKRVIESLKAPSLKAPFSYALHCRAMESAYEDFKHLNTHPVLHWPAIRLYSAAGYDFFTNDPEDTAHRVAKSLCEHLDFPRLVKLAYQDGARLFLEIGAGGNCARWVDEILRGQPSLAMSINRKGLDDGEALVRLLARLASHRLSVDLATLYR